MSLLHGKKRFLILTGDSGFGHRSAANSISKALDTHFPNQSTTHIANPLSESSTPFFIRRGESDYDNNVLNHASFYKFVYDISNLKSTSVLIENTVAIFLQKNIQDLIDRYRPTAIVTTNQWFNAPAGAALQKSKLETPLYTVVTDLADLHILWFNNKPDRYYVASDIVRGEAIANGIDHKRVHVSGIPIDPFFADDERTKAKLKAELGLDPDLPALLYIGSKRVRGALPFLQSLDKINMPFQLVAVAGGDDDTFLQLNHYRWKFPIIIRNYVRNIPEWMKASDLLITKAGGLVLSEAMAAGLPMILIDYLPGQEEGNVKFILDRGIGVLTEESTEFARVVNQWLDVKNGRMAQYAANSKKAGRPSAAIRIATDLIDAAPSPFRFQSFYPRKAFNR